MTVQAESPLMTSVEALAIVREIADGVAAAHAEAVDRDARFPVEAMEALQGRRSLRGARTAVARRARAVVRRACPDVHHPRRALRIDSDGVRDASHPSRLPRRARCRTRSLRPIAA